MNRDEDLLAVPELSAFRCSDALWGKLEKQEYFIQHFCSPSRHSEFKLAVLHRWLSVYFEGFAQSRAKQVFLFDLFAGCGGYWDAALQQLSRLGTPVYMISAALRHGIPLQNVYCSEWNNAFAESLAAVVDAMLPGDESRSSPTVASGPWGRELLPLIRTHAGAVSTGGVPNELFLLCDQFGFGRFNMKFLRKLCQLARHPIDDSEVPVGEPSGEPPAALHMLLFVGLTRSLSEGQQPCFLHIGLHLPTYSLSLFVCVVPVHEADMKGFRGTFHEKRSPSPKNSTATRKRPRPVDAVKSTAGSSSTATATSSGSGSAQEGHCDKEDGESGAEDNAQSSGTNEGLHCECPMLAQQLALKRKLVESVVEALPSCFTATHASGEPARLHHPLTH
jgi:hypothetical protein